MRREDRFRRITALTLALVLTIGLYANGMIGSVWAQPDAAVCDVCGQEPCACPQGDTGLQDTAENGPVCTCVPVDGIHQQGCVFYEEPAEECEYCGAELTGEVVHEDGCPALCTCVPVDGIHQQGCAFYEEPSEVCEYCGAELTGEVVHEDGCPALCTCVPVDGIHQQGCAFYEEPVGVCEYCGVELIENAVHAPSCPEAAPEEKSVTISQTVAGSRIDVTAQEPLPDGVTLAVTVYGVADYAELKQQVLTYLETGEEVVFGYDISLELDGEKYQPESAVTVTVTMSQQVLAVLGYDSVEMLAKDLNLYHIHNGEVDLLSFVADADSSSLSFAVEDFSTFIATASAADLYTQLMAAADVGTFSDIIDSAEAADARGLTADQIDTLLGQVTVLGGDNELTEILVDLRDWKVWDGEFPDGYKVLTEEGGTLSGGKYRLARDIKMEWDGVTQTSYTVKKVKYYSPVDLKITGTVTIDLNGYMLEGSGKGCIIYNTKHLTIEDSRPDANEHYFLKTTQEDKMPWQLVDKDTPGAICIKGGIVTGGRDKTPYSAGSSGGGAVKMGTSGGNSTTYTFTLTGGTIVGNSTDRAGGAVYGGASFMSGGKVIGNYGARYTGGFSLSGQFVFSGGEIAENNSNPDDKYNNPATSEEEFYDNAQVIIGGQSQFTMSGGEIKGNVSTVSYTDNTDFLLFTFSGGEITGDFRLLNELTANISGGKIIGTIFMYRGTCNVSGNAVIEKGGTEDGGREDGGGVCIRSGTFNMSGGIIQDCKATNGGAVYMGMASIPNKVTSVQAVFNMTGGIIQHCEATGNGGAVYMDMATKSGVTTSVSFNMSGGEIKDNSSKNDGGAVYMSSGTFGLSGTGKINNSSAAGNGGAVYLDDGDVTLEGGTIANCYAVANEAKGGGIYVANGDVVMSGGTIDGCYTTKTNSSGDYTGLGGGVYVANGTMTMTGGILQNNKAEKGGGAYLPGGEFNMYGSTGTVKKNSATKDGGGVYLTGADFNMTAGTIEQNHADEDGGGVYLAGGKPNLYNGTLSANTATGNGGGIYIDKQIVQLEPTGTVTVQGNTAAGNGGGIYIDGTAGASNAGFTVLYTNDGEVDLIGNAATSGGGVCVNNGYFTMGAKTAGKNVNISIKDNAATNGGGVAVLSGSFTIEDGSIGESGHPNTAANGGGVYVSGGEAVVRGNGIVQHNKASYGGGVYVAKSGSVTGNLTLSGGAITANTADDGAGKGSGGGFYVNGGNFTMTSGSITDNAAVQEGGGGYVSGGNFVMQGGTVGESGYANTAVNGGGFYVSGGNFFMSGGSVAYNEAVTGSGGGGYISGGIVEIVDGEIVYNSADLDGGGLFASTKTQEAKVIMLSGKLQDNEAGRDGGGIAVVGNSGYAGTIKIGCLMDHYAGGALNLPFDYAGDYGQYGAYDHAYCPVVSGNRSQRYGGGFYLDSGDSSLWFYCVLENDNQANGNDDCWSLGVQGGNVSIGDHEYHNHTVKGGGHASAWGDVQIHSPILVTGGIVNVYGDMDNPIFYSSVKVDIPAETDSSYEDHRRAADGYDHYKVHYVENFPVVNSQGETELTGIYEARQYSVTEGKCLISIGASTFEHAGWKIVGWYLDEEGTGKEYKVGSTYDLCAPEQREDMIHSQTGCDSCPGDTSLLKLYASWQRKSYVTEYHGNPPVEDGVKLTVIGEMEKQHCTLGDDLVLLDNGYAVAGYLFKGWSRASIGAVEYADGATVLTGLTDLDGDTVHLYAVWEKCTHPEEYREYAAEDYRLVETCALCNGHTAYAEIWPEAPAVKYDGLEHPAEVIVSANWIGMGATPGEIPDLIYIKKYDAKWDEEDTDDVYDTWGDPGSTNAPVHAGEYTVKLEVTANGVTKAATDMFEILQDKWQTPANPVFKADLIEGGTKSEVTILSPLGDLYEYQYQEVTDLLDDTWDEDYVFTIDQFNTLYYFYVRQKETRNYAPSDPGRSIMYLSASGIAIVHIDCAEGIDFKDVSVEGDGNFTFATWTKEGFHKRNWTVTITKNSVNGDPATVVIPGTISAEGVPAGAEFYTLAELNEASNFYVTITGAVQDVTVETKVKNGEVFRDFNGETVSISRDSAFTAQYTVQNYLPDEYASQKLVFNRVLPAGTTVIMVTKTGTTPTYWYHVVQTTGSADTVIDLNAFSRMGGSGGFDYSYASENKTAPKAFTYQFIVDFSQSGGGIADVSDLTMTLCLNKSGTITGGKECLAPEISSANSIGLCAAAEFKLELANDGQNTAVTAARKLHVTATYTPSLGHASIWDGRSYALVLELTGTTANAAVPPDLQLIVKERTADGRVLQTPYGMKEQKLFIIPLGELREDSRRLELELSSDLMPEGVWEESPELQFSLKWYVSPSKADSAPLDGFVAAEESVAFEAVRSGDPSVKLYDSLDGTAGESTNRIYRIGGKLKVPVAFANIDPEYEIEAVLLRRNEQGEYIRTGARQTLTPNTGVCIFDLEGHNPGSHCLRVTVNAGASGYQATIVQTDYYFILLDKE